MGSQLHKRQRPGRPPARARRRREERQESVRGERVGMHRRHRIAGPYGGPHRAVRPRFHRFRRTTRLRISHPPLRWWVRPGGYFSLSLSPGNACSPRSSHDYRTRRGWRGRPVGAAAKASMSRRRRTNVRPTRSAGSWPDPISCRTRFCEMPRNAAALVVPTTSVSSTMSPPYCAHRMLRRVWPSPTRRSPPGVKRGCQGPLSVGGYRRRPHRRAQVSGPSSLPPRRFDSARSIAPHARVARSWSLTVASNSTILSRRLRSAGSRSILKFGSRK